MTEAIYTISSTIYDIVIQSTEAIPDISPHVGPFSRLCSAAGEDVETFRSPIGVIAQQLAAQVVILLSICAYYVISFTATFVENCGKWCFFSQ